MITAALRTNRLRKFLIDRMRFNPQIRNADLLSIRMMLFVVSYMNEQQQLFLVAIKKIIAQLHVHEKYFV